MSEEITYANLKFQDSSTTGNIQEFEKVGKKEPAPSRRWNQVALTLTVLCLLLLIGLGVLGGLFYTTLKEEKGQLDELQSVREDLEKNISLQLMSSMNSSKKIRDISVSLQTLATKLCRQLYGKDPDHRCSPCPKHWIWYDDSCYYLTESTQTWKNTEAFCSSQNASLLRIENKSTLTLVTSTALYNFWLGLPPNKSKRNPEQVDEINTVSEWNQKDLDMMYCGYLHGIYVYYIACTGKKKVSCEKMASSVKVESML